MSRLKDRPLQPGRGRVWLLPCRCRCWAADYRHSDKTLYGIATPNASEAYGWIQKEAARHAVR